MKKSLDVFDEANRAAKERMKRFDELLKSPQGKEFAARCSRQKPNPAFVEANRLAKKRMERVGPAFGKVFEKDRSNI